MKPTINIPKPCHAEWNEMSPCSNGRFCGSCQKVVVDFTEKSLDEIHDYFNTHKEQQTCGLYQERHTNKPSHFYTFLNRVEEWFCKINMQKVGLFFIGMALFITGCRLRRTQGEPLPTVSTKSTTKFLTQDSNAVHNKLHVKPQDTTQAKPN